MYYPKSQIKTNLYTYGGEYALAIEGTVYKGFYYKISTGEYYTGKTPDDKPNLLLTPLTQISNEPSNFNNISEIPLRFSDPDPEGITKPDDGFYNLGLTGEYANITQANLDKVQIVPSYISPTPTSQDYEIGEFRRYFCKKTNEILYLEIDKNTYEKLLIKDPQYLYSLYSPFNLPWKLTGDKSEVEKINRNIVLLTSQRLQLPKFGDYLKNNYLKYYR